MIENAGLWTRDHSISPLGFEITFATNTLGHYLLRSRLSSMNILELVTSSSSLVITTSWQKNAPLPSHIKAMDKWLIVAPSWLFYEFASRHPNKFMYLVHPGVINTSLASDNTGIDGYIKSWLCCSTKAGTQESLICSTASTVDLVNTWYHHNTRGLMMLDTCNPVNNQQACKVLYDKVEDICLPYMQ